MSGVVVPSKRGALNPDEVQILKAGTKFYPSHYLDYHFHLLQSNRCFSRQLLKFVIPVAPPVDEIIQFTRSLRSEWSTNLDISFNVSLEISRNYVTQELSVRSD